MATNRSAFIVSLAFVTVALPVLISAQSMVAKPAHTYSIDELESVGKYGVKVPLYGYVIWRRADIAVEVGGVEDDAIEVLDDVTYINKYQRVGKDVIAFLGQVRSVKAVPVLCKRLLWSPTKFQQFTNDLELADPEIRDPATAALIAIGRPAVGGLLDYIVSHPVSKAYLNDSLYVIWKGSWKDYALKGIKTRSAKVKDQSAAQKRLHYLARFIRQYKAPM